MPLPSFTVTGNLYDVPGTFSGGELTRQALANARIRCVSNLPANKLITFAGDTYTPLTEVPAGIDDTASIVDKDGFPLHLIANDAGLSVSGIQWMIVVIMAAAGRLQEIQLGPFDAPAAGGTKTLSTITTAVALPPIDDTVYLINGTPA